LGERIAQARQEAGLTQKQLAEKLGTTQRVLTYWEREAVGLRADQLAKLAEALGVSADYFLGRENKKRGQGPSGRARLIFEEVSKLPRSRQQRILATVEDMLTAQRVAASS
jgi:transcriptional regulator with XRE-family HTH domain